MKLAEISNQSQNEMGNERLWIAIGVVGGLLFISLLVAAIVLCWRKRRTKRGYQTFSDDGGIHSSKSAPCLTIPDPSLLSGSGFIRSRSAGHSPEDSVDDFSATSYPQPTISEANTAGIQSDSSSSLSLTDQYSPFQRSFHVESFPYLEFSTSMSDEAFTVAILSLCNIPDNVRAAADSSSGGFFVKAYLLPDEICRQTKVYRPSGEESQDCNECLSFHTVGDNNGLLLSAYFIDQRHIRVSLGHTTVPLDPGSKGQVYRSRLELFSQALHSNIGELEISLTFFPDKSRLKVDLHCCKDLTLTDVKPSSEMAIRVHFLHGRKLSKESVVGLAKLERNPKINESLSFSLTPKRADVSHLAFLLTEVLSHGADQEPVGRCIGRVDVGPYLYARGEGLLHWQSVLGRPRAPVCMSHFFETPCE